VQPDASSSGDRTADAAGWPSQSPLWYKGASAPVNRKGRARYDVSLWAIHFSFAVIGRPYGQRGSTSEQSVSGVTFFWSAA